MVDSFDWLVLMLCLHLSACSRRNTVIWIQNTLPVASEQRAHPVVKNRGAWRMNINTERLFMTPQDVCRHKS